MSAIGERRLVPGILLALGVAAALLVSPAGPDASADEAWPPPECPPLDELVELVTGVVACFALESAAVGGWVPVSYYLPAACLEDGPCPTITNLHGFGGTYESQLGTAENPSAYVHAQTSRPPVDPRETDSPWEHADTSTWVPAEPLDFIAFAPHGRTVPGGFGPAPHLDSFWADWNPRYAAGGSDEQYDSPPPRFRTFLVEELMPAVEASFPTVGEREWRALVGRSLGGYGAFKNALQRPDLWSAVGSASGAMNFLFVPAPQPSEQVPALPLAFESPPLAPPSLIGGLTLPLGPAEGFTVAFASLGDPVADQAFYRGNMPVDLARNAAAWDGDIQSLYIEYFTNDGIPRRAEDFDNPDSYAFNQFFELAVLPMHLGMESGFDEHGVERDFALNRGLHSGVYADPWLRLHLERLYANVRQRGGGGEPPPRATRFDHRSVRDSVDVWDWSFAVAGRSQVEFLDLFGVSCDGLTLRGTGTVTVTVPAACGTGLDGERSFTVDLGPGAPIVDPRGINLGAATETIALSPLPAPPAPAPPAPAPPAEPEPAPPLPATGDGHALAALALLLAVVVARRPFGADR